MSSHKRKESDTSTPSSSSSSSSSSTIRPTGRQTTQATEATPDTQIKVEGGSPQSTPKKKKHKTDASNPYGEIIYVYVGPDQTRFGIHLNIITNSSPFFHRIFEEKQNVKLDPVPDYEITSCIGAEYLRLPTENPDVFKRFNIWLYSNIIVGPEEKIADLGWDEIFDIYLFALRRNVLGLQNTVIDASIEKHLQCNSVPNSTNINQLYNKGVRAAPFRKLFVDMFVQDGDLSDALCLRKYNSDFLTAVIVALDKLKTKAEGEVRKIKMRAAKRSGKDFDEHEVAHIALQKVKYYVEFKPILIE